MKRDTSDEARIPAIVIVDADPKDRAATALALQRRFGADFEVLTAESAQDGLDLLERLEDNQVPLALIAADAHLPGIGGLGFLEQAHTLYRGAHRALLTAMDDYRTRVALTEMATLRRAAALGQADFFVMKGWATPEEWLYPQVQESLSAWTKANGPRHIVYRIVGAQWDRRCHELRDVLSRNNVPYEFHDAESSAGQRLIREHSIDITQLPAVIHSRGSVLQDPSFAEIASDHGISTRAGSHQYDLVVLGAGPAGLAAGVYGASEGLSTLVIEPVAIGGQAGASSMVRNYLGFARGISGTELAHRAWEQAALFGAEFLFSHSAMTLRAEADNHVITLEDGAEVTGRSVIVSTGLTYRRLQIPALDRLVGAGVFYGAAAAEAPAMAGASVYVAGGANSAGQAALHLARFAERVTLVVRAQSLAVGMSDYLVQQISATSNINVQLGTEVVDGDGAARLESLTLVHTESGKREEAAATALFVLIGAEPHSEWLRAIVELDERNFILTGRDIPTRAWPLKRPPMAFETSLPGVLAAGDVRYGSVKRVASAVGEGSVAVGSVHRYLAELDAGAVT